VVLSETCTCIVCRCSCCCFDTQGVLSPECPRLSYHVQNQSSVVLHRLCCPSTSTPLERRHGSTVQHRSVQHICRSNNQCPTQRRQKMALVEGANLQLVTLFHGHSSVGVFLDWGRKSSSQNDDGPPLHGCYRSHECW
jgi:hypothetical protein